MTMSLERVDQNRPLLSEKEPAVAFIPVKELDLKMLADRTGGKDVEGRVVLWGGKDRIVNGRLSREVNKKTNQVSFRMTTETYRDDVTSYIAVMEEGSEVVALIDPSDPSVNVISGFEIVDGVATPIMGNEVNFPNAYKTARNMAYEASLETLRTH